MDLLRAETARRVRRARAYAVHIGPATVFLSEDDYEIDWASLAFVAVDDPYKGDYRDAFVLDLGAHKGYYGAYALHHGASAVVSYEPEATNHSYLAKAAAGLPRDRWLTRRAAVGAKAGHAALHLMGASWGHALHPPDTFASYEVGVETVDVEPLGEVLGQAVGRAGNRRVVVKLNVEGEECPAILGTPAEAWGGVADVYVETHPWAGCGASELTLHLAAAGFRRVPGGHPAVLALSRTDR
jgi:FkbM family methyltransferase